MTDKATTEQESASLSDPIPAEMNAPQPDNLWFRLESAFGPIIAGILIDIMDLSTFGPIGIFSGMLVGGALAYWICHIYAIPMKQRWIWVMLAGGYCTIPMTEFIPIATIAGAYVRYRNPPTAAQEEPCVEDTP